MDPGRWMAAGWVAPGTALAPAPARVGVRRTRAGAAGGVRRRVRRGGGAAVGMVVMMVIAQLVILSVVVAGARDQDTRVLRYDTMRSQYAADAVTQMALRELFDATDEDGDGAVGSIAGGVVANGPQVNGARGAASVAASGTSRTVLVHGSAGSCTRAMVVNLTTSPEAVTPIAAYATSAAPTVPAVTVYSAGSWSSPVSTSAVGGGVVWQVIRNGPSSAWSARALLTLASDRSLWISRHAAGAWGAASTLTADAGTSNTPVFAAEYESRTGNLMAVYRSGSSTSVCYRTYSTATPPEQTVSLGLVSPPSWMELVGKAGSNQLLLLVAAGSRLHAAVWDGAAWGHMATLETSLPGAGRPFDGAFLSKSGSALVVWTATTGAPRYAVWDGDTWSAAATLPSIAGGVPAGWVRVAASPVRASDEALVAIIGTNNQINANRWSGLAWGSNTLLEASAAGHTRARVDVCYQPDGALGLVVWHRAGQDALLSRTWNGAAWSAPSTGPNPGSETDTIRLVRGLGDTEVMMLARRRQGGYDGYNVYSQYGTVDVGTTVITGPVGSGGSYSLPPAPSVTAGTTNLDPSSGTQIAPGAYGTLTIGNNRTVGFRTGTYVFSSVSLGNSTTLNFDTSAGPILFCVTSGGLVGDNSNSFVNTGGGAVRISVINGNVDFSNSTSFGNFDIVVHNGTATFKNNTMGAVNIWASGDVEFKNNGTISVNGLAYDGTPPALTAVLWTGGVPGTPSDLTTSMVHAGVGDGSSLAGNPLPSKTTIDAWAAVAP
jgi:hypothetical protein